MIQLEASESKSLNFEVDIQGISPDQLQGYLRFVIEGVEYGFPAKISPGNIKVVIPALNKVVRSNIKTDSVVEGRLELVGNGFYSKAWEDKFQLKVPLQVEAKLLASPRISPEKMVVKSITEDEEYVVEEEQPRPRKRKVVKETSKTTSDPKKRVLQEKLRLLRETQAKKKKLQALIERKRLLEEQSVPKPKTTSKKAVRRKSPAKKTQTESYSLPEREITKEDIFSYMKSKGLGNKRVQTMLYESLAGSDDYTAHDTSTDYESILEQVKKALAPPKEQPAITHRYSKGDE